MLSATLYKQGGDIKKSFEYGLESLSVIQDTGNYEQEARVYGFLATQYRLLKLYDKSEKYLNKAIVTNAKIKDPDLLNSQMGLILQEKAYVELDQKQYKKAIKYLNSSQKYFDLVKDAKAVYTISTEHLLGNSFYELGDLKKAELHYQKALQLSQNEPETFLTGIIYNGLALIYIKKNDPGTAKKYIDLSEKVYKNSQFLDLKNEIYTTAQLYYEMTNDLEMLVDVQKKQESLRQKISFEYRKHIIASYTALEQGLEKGNEDLSKRNIFLLLSIIIIFIGAIIFYLSKKRHQRKLQKFRKIINDLDGKIKARPLGEGEITVEELNDPAIKIDQNLSNEEQSPLMSDKTEQKIIAKLHKFENSDLFTQKNMSLPKLATYCGTNIKYLSHVIKKERDKDFTGYINDLRINYIISKLKNDKYYRKYKMAALAEEGGFSSPNKFATIFKNITSFPPSIFIKFIEEENQD